MATPKLPKPMLRAYYNGSFEFGTSSIGLESEPASISELGAIIPGTTHGVAVHSGRATEDGKWHVAQYQQFATAKDARDWVIWIFFAVGQARQNGDQLAFPIDPRMTEKDIEGAAEAYLNETGTAWLFRHSRAGIHHDHLLAVRAAVVGLFQPLINGATVKMDATTNMATKATRRKLRDALIDYCDLVIEEADKAERKHPLGCYVQPADPDVGHVHVAIRKGMTAAKAEWGKTPALLARYRVISALVAPLATSLASPHTPQTRWEIAAAAEAAKKAAEASSDDSTSGE